MTLIVNEDEYERLLNAVNEKAKNIDEDNDKLRTLFEVREAFGPTPETNTGKETLEFTFEKVSRNRAREILLNAENEELQRIGESI